MAGDAQMDPADLPRLLTPLVKDQADYAKGNRLFTGEAWKIIPRYRYLLGNACRRSPGPGSRRLPSRPPIRVCRSL